MEVVVLGSGTLLPDDRRRSAAHLVRTEEVRLLMDCGSGTVHGFDRHQVSWTDLTHVAISHFHTDHFGDLPALLWALRHGVPGGRAEVLTILGPRGLGRVMEGLAAAYGEYILDPGFPLEVVELSPGSERNLNRGQALLRTHEARHGPEALAFRVESIGHAMGYTGDTGPLPALGAFFSGVDVLVSECAVADASSLGNHLDPRSVAAMARDARPAVLVLTHLYPEVQALELPAVLTDLGVSGQVIVARDGLRIRMQRHGTPPVVQGPSDHTTPL
jgi:ribonuclease BN (tRNA processing enzyme)